MSEENTADLTQDEKLDLILAEVRDLKVRVTAVEGRLTAIESRQAALEDRQAAFEAKVGDRLLDTRPLWEVINARTEMLVEQVGEIKGQNAQLVETLRQIDSKLEVMTHDVLDVRAAQRILASRVYALEQRPS
jgi:hypothetical protein